MNKNPGFPLHRFNTFATLTWCARPGMRASIASNLAKLYPKTGVGVLSATLKLFIKIAPNGNYFEIPPPHKSYEMWQVANAPNPVNECACRHYIDLEAGTWGARGGLEGHHPHCQFRDTAILGFKRDAERAVIRLESRLGPSWEHKLKESNVKPQERPDEWLRTAKEIKES